MEDYRAIHTGLYGNINYEIIASVLGQMSDGIWENSSRTWKYWQCVYSEMRENEVILFVYNDSIKWPKYFDCPFKNPYYSKSDEEVKKMFARRIRQVAKINENDYPKNGLSWSKNNNNYLQYMGGHVVEDVSVADAYRAYKILIK